MSMCNLTLLYTDKPNPNLPDQLLEPRCPDSTAVLYTVVDHCFCLSVCNGIELLNATFIASTQKFRFCQKIYGIKSE